MRLVKLTNEEKINYKAKYSEKGMVKARMELLSSFMESGEDIMLVDFGNEYEGREAYLAGSLTTSAKRYGYGCKATRRGKKIYLVRNET